MAKGTGTKIIAGTAAVVAVWALARADTRQPGTVREGITSAGDSTSAFVGEGVSVIINGAREATNLLPPPTSEPANEGGDAGGAG